MADSKENDNDASVDEFADDLDAMLNDASVGGEGQDEVIDDEDAIDRLLMDNAFDVEVEKPDTDDVDKILEKNNSDEVNAAVKEDVTEEVDEFAEEIDEFADDELIDSIVDEAIGKQDDTEAESEADEFDVDDLIDSMGDEAEESSRVEDVAEQTDPQLKEEEVVAEVDDDFLMADFDISADDDFAEDVGVAEPEKVVEANVELAAEETVEETVEQSVEPESESSEHDSLVDDIIDEVVNQEPVATAVVAETPVEAVVDSVAIDEVNAQISQLWAENESLKQQVAALAIPVEQPEQAEDSTAEDIDDLQKEQRKLKKSIKESEGKVPVVAYVALGLAIFALLLAGGFGFVGFGAQSGVDELSELMTTMEEDIEIITASDTSKDVKKIDNKIVLLEANDKGFKKQLNQQDEQLGEMEKKLQTDSLQTVVDDLVTQNDHAQKAIELLLAKVETLEVRKKASAAKKVKKPVVKAKWTVNLVSFKQEWYAKRKAVEFQKKGVSAEVLPAKVDGENWFRLRVKGFNSKYEAAAYAVKVKKTLNLTSVWVTKE